MDDDSHDASKQTGYENVKNIQFARGIVYLSLRNIRIKFRNHDV